MKNLILTSIVILTILSGCQETQKGSGENLALNPDKPISPWVFRSVLDVKPRMITIALDDETYAAFSTQTGRLYKVWNGEVDFDGAVYTTAHGPQPEAIGNAYLVDSLDTTPWQIKNGDELITPSFQYKGHKFTRGSVALNYELSWDGNKTMVSEWVGPESNTIGKGLKRSFSVENVPAGMQVMTALNVASIKTKDDIITNGTFNIDGFGSDELDGEKSMNINGSLTLQNDGPTDLSINFSTPILTDPLADVVDDRPLGAQLIAKSDCKSCHNLERQTIGPSYKDIAKKYENTEDNRNTLIEKITTGGSGVWGAQVMSPHPNTPREDIAEMVGYIMSLDAAEEEEFLATQAVAAPEDLDYVYSKVEVDSEDMLPGLLIEVSVFEKDLFVLDDMKEDGTTVYHSTIPNIHLTDDQLSMLESNFGAIFTGYLRIPSKGLYTLRLVSDDGSRMFLNDSLVIDNDGQHGADAVDAELALEQGIHKLKVEYFQGYGGRNVSMQWNYGGEFTPIPPTALGYNKNDAPSNMSVSFQEDKNIPGHRSLLTAVHPSFDLTQARSELFTPRVAGMDFLSDGRLVVSTWDPEGSVYIVDGVQSGNPEMITEKRIAAGLAEPLGLKVVNDEIYILQKQELTKLVDLDGDEMIDEYQTISNDWRVSANFHEFAFGLVYEDGYFYGTLATAINPGGASTQPQIQDRGRIVKISEADGSVEFIAQGLRTPNGIGIGHKGEMFIADNQGDWLPASKIVHVQEGAFYGSRSVDFEGTANLTEQKPVVWLPQDEVGNSPSTPMYLNVGPYEDQMIHGEVTNGGIKRVFVEEVDGQYQGALFRFVQGLEAGVNRLMWGPDGALYVGGIGSSGNWQQYGKLWYGLQRLKFNEKSTFEMLAVRAKSNGVEIEFTEPLKSGDGWNPESYLVQQWYYLPTEEYGGPKLDEKELDILSVNVSEDRKKVFLELDGMEEDHMIYIHLQESFVSDTGGELWTSECWYTMNSIPQNNPGFSRSNPDIAQGDNTLTDAEKAAGWRLLFDGETTAGWHIYNQEGMNSAWKVEDGALAFDKESEDGGDLITDDEFENFELELEWMIQDCGNSGIMYFVTESEEYGAPYLTGPEMQVLDNTCHPDAQYDTHKAGDLYDMKACEYIAVNPANTWNKVRLVANGNHIEHWLNGRKLVEFDRFTPEWDELIANSKFKDWEGFGMSKTGKIALQDHGDNVWFRNIKVREF